MPWEKSFNEEKVIAAAMQLFWEKGYSDTSMAELLKATGLTKGSFYNAFGSKYELFQKAIVKYELENRRMVLQKLVAMDAPVKAIEYLFEAIIQETIDDPAKRGCFIINTCLDLNAHKAEIKDIISGCMRETETFFKQMIELGQFRKEIPQTIDPQKTAKALVATLVGIRILGRAIYDKQALQDLATQSLKLIGASSEENSLGT